MDTNKTEYEIGNIVNNSLFNIESELLTIANTLHFRYDEDVHISEFIQYIVGTYSQHYAQEQIQAFEFIADSGHGIGFSVGNILKYAKRLGKKLNGSFIKDTYKIIHYAILALYANRDNKEI